MCPVVAELCWSGPFRSRPRSIPVPDRGHPCTTPDPLPDKPLSRRCRRWDLRDRSQAEWTASHGSQWVTLATGCVLASARALAMQGKPALNRCTTKMPCRWSENERQPAWVASTCISLRCKLYTYIQYIYILYLNLSICLLIYVSIYIYVYMCIACISSHSKGPEQDQLRSPFVPYVRNTAERSIHNFDSQPYVDVKIRRCQGFSCKRQTRFAAAV